MSSAPLHNKVALVTGSSRGMGREFALELARRGCSVVVNYNRSSGPAHSVVEEIEALGGGQKAIAIQADVRDPSAIKNLFSHAVSHAKFGFSSSNPGKLDIVVSNSGIEHFNHISKVTPEEFDDTFEVNTRGQFFVAQQAYEHLKEGGRLILMSSVSAKASSVRDHAVYAGSKSAVEAFARCLSTDFGHKRITVNAIAPGGVKSDMYAHAARNYIPGGENFTDEQVDQKVATMSPMNRVGMPDDISRVVAFLASEDGRWVNGQTITISGSVGI